MIEREVFHQNFQFFSNIFKQASESTDFVLNSLNYNINLLKLSNLTLNSILFKFETDLMRKLFRATSFPKPQMAATSPSLKHHFIHNFDDKSTFSVGYILRHKFFLLLAYFLLLSPRKLP